MALPRSQPFRRGTFLHKPTQDHECPPECGYRERNQKNCREKATVFDHRHLYLSSFAEIFLFPLVSILFAKFHTSSDRLHGSQNEMFLLHPLHLRLSCLALFADLRVLLQVLSCSPPSLSLPKTSPKRMIIFRAEATLLIYEHSLNNWPFTFNMLRP